MKWLGKHIIDIIAHFRSDVYLEDIDSGTIVTGGVLGLNSDNKIVKTASGASSAKLNYAIYTYTFATEGGAISTINLTAVVSLPTDAVIDAENSYIVTQVPIGGNAGATIEIGINNGGGGGVYLGADTDFFMAPTAYNATNFSNYGGVIKGLAKVGRINATTQITWKIATATLTSGYVEVYIAYKTTS
tara:strand:+ start:1434 stop:1997 length:564 start_codon:yes stop_codon:yes gene_type:complete